MPKVLKVPNVVEMPEKSLSIGTGAVIGGISSFLNSPELLKFVIFSFIGGMLGWFGGKCAKYIDRKCGCYFSQGIKALVKVILIFRLKSKISRNKKG